MAIYWETDIVFIFSQIFINYNLTSTKRIVKEIWNLSLQFPTFLKLHLCCLFLTLFIQYIHYWWTFQGCHLDRLAIKRVRFFSCSVSYSGSHDNSRLSCWCYGIWRHVTVLFLCYILQYQSYETSKAKPNKLSHSHNILCLGSQPQEEQEPKLSTVWEGRPQASVRLALVIGTSEREGPGTALKTRGETNPCGSQYCPWEVFPRGIINHLHETAQAWNNG